MPPTFEVSATLTSARVVAGDSVGLVITATNTGAVTIKVPVRYRLARIPCEGNGGVANGVMGIWGGAFGVGRRRLDGDSTGAGQTVRSAPSGCDVEFGSGEAKTETVWFETPTAGMFEVIGSYSWKRAAPVRLEVVR
jgi:hypothetical protein